MSHPETGGRTRRGFTLAYGLWLAAATFVVAGFVLRVLASLTRQPQVRLSGVVLIALGLGVAGVGWISERLAERRAP